MLVTTSAVGAVIRIAGGEEIGSTTSMEYFDILLRGDASSDHEINRRAESLWLGLTSNALSERGVIPAPLELESFISSWL